MPSILVSKPVPRGHVPLIAGTLVVALALPVFLIAHWRLAAWGIALCPRAAPAEPMLGPGLDRTAYEGLRPSPEDACRVGDARVIAMTRGGE